MDSSDSTNDSEPQESTEEKVIVLATGARGNLDDDSDSEYESTLEVSLSKTTVVSWSNSDNATSPATVAERESIPTEMNPTDVRQPTTCSHTTRRSKSTIINTEKGTIVVTSTDDGERLKKLHTPLREPPVKMHKSVEAKVTPTVEVPVFSPLLLRVNPLHRSRTAQLKGILLRQPIEAVIVQQAYTKVSTSVRLVPSLEIPLQCTITIPSYFCLRAQLQFIHSPPTQNVVALVSPAIQPVKTHMIPRQTEKPHLMLAPEGPLQAESLPPLWDTITLTVALGKHVAVEYSIPTIPIRKIRYYKVQSGRAQKVEAKTLYRKAKVQNVMIWTAEKAHQLILSTVEKADPQTVRIVKLEQNPSMLVAPRPVRVPSDQKTTELSFHDVNATSCASTTSTPIVHRRRSNKKKRTTTQEHQLVGYWEASPGTK